MGVGYQVSGSRSKRAGKDFGSSPGGQKYVEMLHQKDLLATTGYIKGGCSPIGMKKLFPTFIDKSRENFDSIIFSGGKIGKQVQVGVKDVVSLTRAKLEFICKEEPCL